MLCRKFTLNRMGAETISCSGTGCVLIDGLAAGAQHRGLVHLTRCCAPPLTHDFQNAPVSKLAGYKLHLIWPRVKLFLDSVGASCLIESVKQRYHTIIKPQHAGWFVGWVEEIPGTITHGKSLEECRENLKDSLQIMLETHRDEAQSVPRRKLHPGIDRNRCDRSAAGVHFFRLTYKHSLPNRFWRSGCAPPLFASGTATEVASPGTFFIQRGVRWLGARLRAQGEGMMGTSADWTGVAGVFSAKSSSACSMYTSSNSVASTSWHIKT